VLNELTMAGSRIRQEGEIEGESNIQLALFVLLYMLQDSKT
jgi:hypothetical protein